VAILRCPRCKTESAASSREYQCACGGLLDVEHRFRPLERTLFDQRLGALEPPHDSGVWRYRELVYPRFPREAIVSLREGNTPLYRSRAVANWTGLDDLWLKHEGLNPTGSFKDRGMTVAVSRARASGAQIVACASTGNTSASLAAYAAAGCLRAVIVVPEHGTPPGKLSQAVAYGARTLRLRGDFDRGLELLRRVASERGIWILNSLNPFRIEGQKAIVFELLQQLEWSAPDWIAFPAGNLGNCAAFGKALREARAANLIDRVPRLAAVQASGAAPFARAFREDFSALVPVRAETIASAIRIGNPASYARAVRSIRETRGVVSEVDDEQILEAKGCVDRAGIGAEPASCAAVAGVRRLVREGAIAPWEQVVCVLTGHLLKDPDTTLAMHAGGAKAGELASQPALVIDATEAALRAAFDASTPS
jgi:threonine synthase